MNGVLKRSLSQREKVLILALVLLLVVGVYFFAVYFPIRDRMAAIEQQNVELDTQIAAAQAKAQEYSDMQAELEEIFALPPEKISMMPPYNNIEPLMRMLDNLFAGTEPHFNFGQASINGNIASRTISFTCTTAGYEAARQILRDVAGCGYRSLLNSFSFTPAAGGTLYDGAVQVSGSVTFYELVPETETEVEAEAETPAEGEGI